MGRGPTSLSSLRVGGTLAEKLVKVGDNLRDLNTRFGVRRCVVRQVRTRWSSGRRWQGEETVISEVELLPNPKVVDLATLREVASSTGLMETGAVAVDEISGRYTEDFLRGLGEGGAAIPDDEGFYYEIEFKPVGAGGGVKRRFTLGANPNYVPAGVRWVITLNAAQGGRQRDGSPR